MKYLTLCVVLVGVFGHIYGYGHGAFSSQNQQLHNYGSEHEHGGHEEYHSDYYAHPKYSFEYGVKDHKTGDDKGQWEIRDGDKVSGGYNLKEADGTIRVVEYTADKHSGFNAVVKRIGKAEHPAVYKSHEHEGGYEKSYGYEH